MDSFEDDIFTLSDDEEVQSLSTTNPIQDHFRKQLNIVQERIDSTKNDIEEAKETIQSVSNSLSHQIIYGTEITSDSDSNLYTVDGEPAIKKQRHATDLPRQVLRLKNVWQRTFDDKWIIGVELRNTSRGTLSDLEFYVFAKGKTKLEGISAFWGPDESSLWTTIDEIEEKLDNVVATVRLDLPIFKEESEAKVFGTIVYKIDEKELQTAVPVITLTTCQVVDDTYALNFSIDAEFSVLALKASAVVVTVLIPIEEKSNIGVRIFQFFDSRSFKGVCNDVYVTAAVGSLMFCVIEILPIVDKKARLRISARSAIQSNLMLRLIRDEFTNIIIDEEDAEVKAAAKALMEELESYLKDCHVDEIQKARIKTDLLIP